MKTILISLRLLVLALVMAGSSQLYAEGPAETEALDSIEISLITCSPHDEVYSLYGHTALRFHDLRTGQDLVFNYGVFNFKAPHFVLRFVFGLTDYELGIAPFAPFREYYKGWGCMMTEQVLNLTATEKQSLIKALQTNSLPQNRVYRYNFFFDNCATRPRNMIESNLQGKVEYAPRTDYAPSFREMIREHTRLYPWATFGNDILLGFRADMKTDMREQEFLPDNLRFDFERAVVNRGGQREPLVKERRLLLPPGIQIVEEGFPLTPMMCAIVLLVISLAVLAFETAKKKTQRWFDIGLMLATGLAGCVLFVMLFSQHPATSTNLQILVLNPLSLFFIPAVARGRKTRWFTISLCLVIAFYLGAFLQDYAEGMEILALCLLLRFVRHIHDK